MASMTIKQAFDEARRQKRAALIPYVTGGYPRVEQLPEMIEALANAGADVIEVGLPFSDPLADGPVLQMAATEALHNGVRLRDIFAAVKTVSHAAPPIVFLTYINPVYHMGIEVFCEAAADCGAQGLIIPDLPWSEGKTIRKTADRHGLAIIPLVAPTSQSDHLEAIRHARGFVYGVSITGVTGIRQSVDMGAREMVDRIHARVSLPVALGFGISTPEQAQKVGQWADGVIVGSALVKAIAEQPERASVVAHDFVAEFRQAMQTPPAKLPAG